MGESLGPSWVEVVWVILSAVGVAVAGWVANTLRVIEKNADEQVRLLRWLRDVHDDHAKFYGASVLPLLEKNVRLSRAALETIRWTAEQQTGQEPPPATHLEDL